MPAAVVIIALLAPAPVLVATATFVTPIALKGRTAAFLGLVPSTAGDGLFLSRKGVISTLLLAGDPTPLGGAFSSFDQAEPISLAGKAVVFEASLSAGSGAAVGLFSAAP